MFGIRLSKIMVAGAAIGLTATVASADVLGPGLNGLKASAPLSDVVKVHEGHGGMHKGSKAQSPWRLPRLPLARVRKRQILCQAPAMFPGKPLR